MKVKILAAFGASRYQHFSTKEWKSIGFQVNVLKIDVWFSNKPCRHVNRIYQCYKNAHQTHTHMHITYVYIDKLDFMYYLYNIYVYTYIYICMMSFLISHNNDYIQLMNRNQAWLGEPPAVREKRSVIMIRCCNLKLSTDSRIWFYKSNLGFLFENAPRGPSKPPAFLIKDGNPWNDFVLSQSMVVNRWIERSHVCIKYKSFLFRGKEKQLPSLKLTLQVKMDGWNTSFLAGGLF